MNIEDIASHCHMHRKICHGFCVYVQDTFGKSWNFCPGDGKSWKLMLENV